MLKFEIGDIVRVDRFTYPDGRQGEHHNFVIIGINQDELKLIDLDYMCFIISSNTDKSNNVNPKYPFNEPIPASRETGLKRDGHVKCDELIEGIKKDRIIMHVGSVSQEQYDRFTELFWESLNSNL